MADLALHTLQRLPLLLCNSVCIYFGCLSVAFTEKAGAVGDDLSLIRSYEVIEEVLQIICYD